MDERSVLVVLAIVFLLWLIRTWAQWDSEGRFASDSRKRLQARLEGSSLRENVAGVGLMPLADTSDAENTRRVASRHYPDSDSLATSTAVAARESTVTESDIARLLKQLEQAEARARMAAQNDLELRRLRSELASVKLEKSNAIKDIDVLERRISEQQATLDSVDVKDSVRAEGVGESVNNVDGNQQPPSDEPAANSRLAAKKELIPLYQAPAHRDDLKLINGIGPVMEHTLNELGVTTFKQLAGFNQNDIDKVSEAIGTFPGRIERDDWVGKARVLLGNNTSAK